MAKLEDIGDAYEIVSTEIIAPSGPKELNLTHGFKMKEIAAWC